MANTIRLEGRRRSRGDKPDQLVGENSNDASLSSSSSSSFLYGSGNDHAIFENERTRSRQLLFDEVTKLSGNQCSLTTSLRTGYKGRNAASGLMFTIQPSESIELLTLEFPTFENYGSDSNDPLAARKVKVYYRLGSFSNAMADSSAWTLIANTSARLVSPLPPPDASNAAGLDVGAIIPANEFESVLLKADQMYSIYISGEASSPNPNETLLKVKPADGLIGDMFTENESLQIQTGVRLKGSPFPSMFEEPADFNGVLHYRATKLCNDSTMFATTEIDLEFAVNSDPNSKVMGSLRTAVDETLSEWISTNENLARFSEKDMLQMEGIEVHFRGRNEEKCPIDFVNCALVTTIVSFKHLHNLDRGLLEMEILGQYRQLDEYVASYMNPVEASYVGDPLSKAEFAITLTGVPTGKEMNDVQKRYFEEVTVNFLRNHIASKIFNALVTNEVPETLYIEDGEPPASRTRSRNLVRMPMIRTRRKLEDSAASAGILQIITEIAAEGSVPELRTTVLEGIGNNPVQFTRELISHQMRPVEINENGYGDFFADLTNVQVNSYVSKDGVVSSPGGETGNSTPVETGASVYLIVCILLIVFSLLWICFRIYMDFFYSPFQKLTKLKKDKDELKKLKSSKDEFMDEEEESLNSAILKKSLFGRLKIPSGFQGVSSKTDGKNVKNQPSITRGRSFSDLLNKDVSKKSLSDTAPARISGDTFEDDRDLSCSDGDIEISDDESVERLPPRRSLSGPKRGRLTPSKSLPVQKGNQQRKSAAKSPLSEKPQRPPRRSPSGPKRGMLTPSKSLPMQKRNRVSPRNDNKNGKKATTKSPESEKPQRSAPHRSSSGPKRGRLVATKSMPVQKRNKPSTDTEKQRKSLKSPLSEIPKRASSHRSPSGPRRGRLTPSKSMPVQKRDVKRNKSMPVIPKNPRKKLDRPSSHSASKKIDRRSSHSASKKIDRQSSHSASKKIDRKSSHSASKKIDRQSSNSASKKIDRQSSHSASKKIDRQSSHSASKKEKTVEKKRGIKATKSMPIQERESNQESESSIKKLVDMLHDSTSGSDSEFSESSSENSFSNSSPANKSLTSEQSLQKSSWHRAMPKKTNDARKSPRKSPYGKAGKIQFGGGKKR